MMIPKRLRADGHWVDTEKFTITQQTRFIGEEEEEKKEPTKNSTNQYFVQNDIENKVHQNGNVQIICNSVDFRVARRQCKYALSFIYVLN